jgi:hypothetical protein
MLMATSGRSAAGEERCFEDWSVAAMIVAREKLATVEQLQTELPPGIGGAIVRTTLCQEAAGFVYRVLIRDRSGKLTKATIAASRK